MMTCRDSAVRAEQSASAHSVQNNGQCEYAHVNVSLTPPRLLSHPGAVTCWPGGENRAQIGLFKCEFETGVEFGSGAGFAKYFIKNKNFRMSDLSDDDHLDFKKVDAQATKFSDDSFNYVIASNMIHHIPYPIKFFREMNRILKKNGKLIIFESYCSIFFQLATIVMKHEGFDFTKNVWDENDPKSDEKNAWAGNIAVPHLLFDDKETFKNNMGNFFSSGTS